MSLSRCLGFAAVIFLTAGSCLAQAPAISPDGVVPLFSKANITNTIQPGSWISIYGSNLAASTASWNGDFPTALAGTSVTVNGKPAYLWFVSPGQINVQTPDDTKTGAVTIGVTTARGSAFASVNLASFAPAFSLLDAKHVTGIILRTDTSGTQGGGTWDILGPTGNSLGYPTVAAAPGDSVVIFGVGFGPTLPIVPAGKAFQGAAPITNGLNLTINGTLVPTTFIGLSSAGLYQINLTVPAGLGAGELPLVASNGSQTQSGVVISLRDPPPAPQLQSLTLSSNTATGSDIITGTVTLSTPAPLAGVVVRLSSSSASATLPVSVTVPARASSATFSITINPVTATQTVTIGASLTGISRQAILSLAPQTVISSSTQTISTGQSSTFTLSDGSGVSIPAGFVQTSQIATLSLLPVLPDHPPSGLIAGVGRVLKLTLAPPASPSPILAGSLRPAATPSPSPDVQLTLNLSTTAPASLSGAMGMIQLAAPPPPRATRQPQPSEFQPSLMPSGTRHPSPSPAPWWINSGS